MCAPSIMPTVYYDIYNYNWGGTCKMPQYKALVHPQIQAGYFSECTCHHS